MQKLVETFGPWAVVTGASDGIGRAIATELARRNVNVVLVARRKERLADVAADLMQRFAIEARPLAVDLADADAAHSIDRATEDLDVGLLVAAAGYGASRALLESDLQAEVGMVDVNCRALLALSALFGARLQRRGRGGMILVSSLFAFQGVARSANYAATKAYVQTLAEGLHDELAASNVHVCALAPGPVSSGFAQRADMKLSISQTPESVALAAIKGLMRNAATIRPGFLSKALEFSLLPLPRRGRSLVLKRIMSSMTRHQTHAA